MGLHDLLTHFHNLAFSWEETKYFVEHSVAFSSDALHVLAGVVLMLGVALVLGRPLSSWAPWSAVFALILLNEFIDLWIEQWPHPGMQYGESARDLLLTMALPTMLLLAARHYPGLWSGRGDHRRAVTRRR